MGMPQHHKKFWLAIRTKLIEELELGDGFFTALRKNELVSKIRAESLRNEFHSKCLRRENLLDSLERGTSTVLRDFVCCLKETEQNGLVQYITEMARIYDIPEHEFMPEDVAAVLEKAPDPPQDLPETAESEDVAAVLEKAPHPPQDSPETAEAEGGLTCIYDRKKDTEVLKQSEAKENDQENGSNKNSKTEKQQPKEAMNTTDAGDGSPSGTLQGTPKQNDPNQPERNHEPSKETDPKPEKDTQPDKSQAKDIIIYISFAVIIVLVAIVLSK